MESQTSQQNAAVVIVDMQDIYLNYCSKKHDLIDKQIEMIELCERNKIPIFNLYQASNTPRIKIGPTIPSILRPGMINVEKKYADGTMETNLVKKLRQRRISECFLAGVHANACVRATARGLSKNGFKISTSLDVIDDAFWIDGPDGLDWYIHNTSLMDSYLQFPFFSKP